MFYVKYIIKYFLYMCVELCLCVLKAILPSFLLSIKKHLLRGIGNCVRCCWCRNPWGKHKYFSLVPIFGYLQYTLAWVEHMLHFCYMSCIGYQSVSRSNSRFFRGWSMKPYFMKLYVNLWHRTGLFIRNKQILLCPMYSVNDFF